MAIGAAITAVGGLLLEGVGLVLQGEETKKARGDIKKENQLSRELQLEGMEKQYDLGLKRLRADKAERRRQWKWKEEERDWNRVFEFADRFVTLMDRQPQHARRMTEVWRNAA